MTQKSKVRLATTSRYTLMILLAAIFALPLLFMVISSFKPGLQILQDSSSLRAFLPVGDLSMQNYFDAFDRAPVARFIFNSILVTTVTLALGLFFCSLAAFALACLRWKGQGIVLTIIIATFIVPFETIAVPLLMIVSRLPTIGAEGFSYGWLNTYHVQIIPFIVDAFTIFLFVQFFKSLPYDLIEAARIDGASWFQIYARIIVPVSGPVFATVAILRFLTMWNQYLWPVLVIRTDQFRPIMVGWGYFGGGGGVSMAYLIMATLPVLILFFVLQHAFIRSISVTGNKG
ncbi:MAG: carbohydrate ABC transporter permease [Anaerolineae bacterium]|nr:carbohydrate ABC transporter permease [Anaerolineae bacterium]